MSAAEIVAALRAVGVEVSVTERGTLRLVPPPPPDLLDAARAAKSDIIAALTQTYTRGPCAEAAGCNPDGFGWSLPTGLIPILDARGRLYGWMLDPAWKADLVDDHERPSQDAPRRPFDRRERG